MNFENVKWVPLETTLKELREPMSYVETSKSLYMKLWYRADTQAFAVPVYAEPSDGSKIVETVEHDNIICVGRQVNKGFHELFENGEKKVRKLLYTSIFLPSSFSIHSRRVIFS